MINLRPAKNIQGDVMLPVSPDLLFMAGLGACAARRAVCVSGVGESAVITDIIRALQQGHADVEVNDGVLRIIPKTDTSDTALLLTLPESLLPYRMIYMFMGLGMGKTVTATSQSLPQKQIDNFIALAKRIGITAEKVEYEQTVGLKAAYFDSGIIDGANIADEDDCAALLAFLFGKCEKASFTITGFHLLTPLRQMAHAFGFVINAKSLTANNDDSQLARRMRFLQGKQRDASTQSIVYTVDIDCRKQDSVNTDLLANSDSNGHINNDTKTNVSVNACIADSVANPDSNGHINTDINTNPDINTMKDINYLNITIPGDEILAAALLCLKCISPKGDLTISNAPLESWATQTLSFIKKMGCQVNVKEEGKTSFGLRGALAVKKSACNGRKVRCLPHYQYFGQLPAMAVASAFAEGKSVFRELQPLRLCEPDGLDQLEQCLRPLGARHGEMPDGIVVEGAKEFDGFDILEPLPAHIAAAFCMAGLKCRGKTSIADDFIFARWPNFEKTLNDICEFRSK